MCIVYKRKNQLDATKCWFIDSTCFEHYYAHLQECVNEYRFLVSKPVSTQLTALHYTIQTAYRFGHQEALLTNVLLKMGIIMLKTC
jgi:hypothetical protein